MGAIPRQGEHGRLRLTVRSPGTSARQIASTKLGPSDRRRRARVQEPTEGSQLLVSGHAELGGVLEPVPSEGKLAVGHRWALLQANGGLSGTFSAVGAPGFLLEAEQAGSTYYVTVVGKKVAPSPRASRTRSPVACAP